MTFNKPYDHKLRGKPLGACPLTSINFKRLPSGELERVEDIPFYEQIQSYKEELSIERILMRNGIVAADSLPDSAFVDTTTLPGSFDEVQKLKVKVRSQFESLPESLRQYYGNCESYMADIESGNFEKVLSAYFTANGGSGAGSATGTAGAGSAAGAAAGASNSSPSAEGGAS